MQGTNVSVIDHPELCSDSYSEQDRADVRRIIDWLNGDATRYQSMLARAARINPGTLNSVLRGKYTTSPRPQIDKCLDAIGSIEARSKELVRIAYVETSVWELVHAACRRARLYRNISVVAGAVGTGKTRALEVWAERNPGAILIQADPTMSGPAFLDAMVLAVDASVAKSQGSLKGAIADRMQGVLKALKGSDALIILDEAETCTPQVLEILRRIRDLAQVGVVLSGTEALAPLIRREQGRFGQIRSRVGFWPPTIKGISREDCDAVFFDSFEDLQPQQEHFDAAWQVCGGSMRVLVEGLIPGIRDFVLGKGRDFCPKTIVAVGRQAMGLHVGGGA